MRNEKKYNYFYKITNKVNNKFYYGVHSTDNIDDGYMGSGTKLKIAIKKYGIENFSKEILVYFETREEAYIHESEMVTEELVKDKECYNISIGGKGARGVEICKDYIPSKDKDGNIYYVKNDDDRLKNGTLTFIWKGRHHSEETKKKMSETHKKNKRQQGYKNSQFGTCWITKNGENKKIYLNELGDYISYGWVKGRHKKNKIEYDDDLIKKWIKEGINKAEIARRLNLPYMTLVSHCKNIA